MASLLLSACSSAPEPEIVGENIRDNAFEGTTYKVFVDCTIYNGGCDGEVEASATLRGGGFWKKRQTVFIFNGRERRIAFEFPETELFILVLSGYEYSCQAE